MAAKDFQRIRKACSPEKSGLLLAAIKAGHPYKMTRSNGIIIYAPGGIAGTHLGGSDHRGAENFRAELRKVGIIIEKGK